jgi:hypothetical protein
MYKLLPQLPHVPDEICNAVDLYRRPARGEVGTSTPRYLQNWFGREMESLKNTRVKFEPFETWVKANITDKFLDASINYILYDRTNGVHESIGAHSDRMINTVCPLV